MPSGRVQTKQFSHTGHSSLFGTLTFFPLCLPVSCIPSGGLYLKKARHVNSIRARSLLEWNETLTQACSCPRKCQNNSPGSCSWEEMVLRPSSTELITLRVEPHMCLRILRQLVWAAALACLTSYWWCQSTLSTVEPSTSWSMVWTYPFWPIFRKKVLESKDLAILAASLSAASYWQDRELTAPDADMKSQYLRSNWHGLLNQLFPALRNAADGPQNN